MGIVEQVILEPIYSYTEHIVILKNKLTKYY